MMRSAYHLSFDLPWQLQREHRNYAFDDRYTFMNGSWILLPPPPPQQDNEQSDVEDL